MAFPAINNGALRVEVLLWVQALNLDTQTIDPMGLWSGPDNFAVALEGQQRNYYGAGAVIDVPSIISAPGFNVQTQTASLAILTPEVELLMRGYDARQAPVEIHIARFDPDTNDLLGINRVFQGWLDRAPIRSGQKDTNASLDVSLASSSQELTRKSTLKKSDASQQNRNGDRFFKYADVSGSVKVYWNMERST